MLSKSKGQILRVAVAMEVLFSMFEKVGEQTDHPNSYTTDDTNEVSVSEQAVHPSNNGNKISDAAISAAINFVELCVQQAAYMAGRGDIKKDIELIKSSISEYIRRLV